MKPGLDAFYEFISHPVRLWSRLALVALAVPLVLTFTQPLWNITMVAPQYPNGLSLDIYTHKVEGGRNGADIQEINTLNHYIGMAHIDRVALSDLDWLPFAFGGLTILALRVAAIGTISSLIDLTVVSLYFSLFAMARFVYRLWLLGHNLDPMAPVKMTPFTPPVFGTEHIANFTVTSLPRLASGYAAVFVVGVCLLTAWHLIIGRREAARLLDAAKP